MNRKKLTLLILCGILVLALGYALWRTPRQKTVAQLKFAPGAKADATRRGAPATDKVSSRVRLDLLNRPVSSFSGFRRNIFQPFFGPDVGAGTGGRGTKNAKIPKMIPLPPPTPVGTPAPYVPPKDTPNFKFLGFLQKEGRKVVFLASDNEVFLARKGEKIHGRYEVVRMTDDALTLRSLTTGDETVISMADQRPLVRQVE